MGTANSVPQIRAKEVKRVCENKCGWLCKRGLTNTSLQRRWCAVHDLHLYYFENPRSDEPKGVVNLKGAIVNRSKKVKMALEIETGALVAEKGLEKRTYMFTTQGADAKVRGMMSDTMKREQKKRDQEQLEFWLKVLQNVQPLAINKCTDAAQVEETAKTFTPS